MTKPAKEGPDPAKLLTDTPKPDPDDIDDAPPDAAEDAGERDDFEDDDALSLDELDESIRRSVEQALGEIGDGEGDDGEAPEGETVEQRVKRLEAKDKKNEERKAKEAEVRRLGDKAKEMVRVAKDLRLTKEQFDRTVAYYDKNPDLEDVVPFRDAAIRVNGLGGRSQEPVEDGRKNGDSPRGPRAQVITRGGPAPRPRVDPFKPTANNQGDYSAVSAAIRKDSNIMRRLVRTAE